MKKIKAQVKLITAPSSFAFDGERKYRQLLTMSSAGWQRLSSPTIGWMLIGMKQRNQQTLGVILIYLEQTGTTCLECLLCLSVSKTHIFVHVFPFSIIMRKYLPEHLCSIRHSPEAQDQHILRCQSREGSLCPRSLLLHTALPCRWLGGSGCLGLRGR